MRRWKIAYIIAILVAGWTGVVAAVFYPGSEIVAAAAGHLILSVLTYPLGSLASAAIFLFMYLGLMTPMEVLAAMTPVFVILGYVQWFRLFPALYGSSR